MVAREDSSAVADACSQFLAMSAVVDTISSDAAATVIDRVWFSSAVLEIFSDESVNSSIASPK